MMRVWSHRPKFLHLVLFYAAYVLGCGFAQALSIAPGTNISIWPPGGLLMATLILAPPPTWPWWMLSGCLAELTGQIVWFHSPLTAGVLMYVGNALEAAAGAWLVNRFCGRPVRFDTLQEVLAFVVFGAGIAPLISATVGAATLAWFGVKSQSFGAAWPLWWVGDATGILLVAPLALVVFQNWHDKAEFSAARWIEACVLGLILLGVAALSLSGYLPFAFIVMPPLLWAAVRFEFKGAAVTLAVLALITAVFTISGASQFAGDPESQRQKQVMLHLFLAISALSALIVAAISRQHQLTLQALRTNEQRLQQLIDAVPALIWTTTREGTPTYLNKRYTDVTGATLKDLTAPDGSSAPLAVVHPDDLAASAEVRARAFETGSLYVVRYRQIRRDGSYRWTETRAEPLRDASGEIVQWYGVSVDIHDLVTAQEALREREQQLQQLVDAIPAFIWCLTPEGTPSYFNKRVIDQIGLTVADLTAPDRSLSLASVHPDDRPAVERALAHSLETGDPFGIKYRQRRGRAPYRWTEGRAEALRDEDGRIVQWYGVYLDIEDEVVAQQQLREREHQLAQLVDIVPALIWRLTPDGEPAYFNKRLIDYFGLDVTDVDTPEMSRLAAVTQAVVHPDDAQALTERLSRSLMTGESFSLRYRLRRHDGVYRWIEGRAAPMRNRDGEIVQWYGLCLDVEDEIRTQEALRRAQDQLARATQAASLSELSASIAHEVNQPLAAIVTTSHACRRWLSADPPNLDRAKITLDRIIRDANSASEVVSRIRGLFSQMGKARSSADIVAVIGEVSGLMADELAIKNIQVETDFELSLPHALIDRIQMQQVLVNLIRNAIDAFDTVVDGTRLIRLCAAVDGDSAIRVEVRDLGAGMKEPERIFEPFFTTKQHGMGMGLAICRSIIESHDGRLWAIGNQPRGTTFAFTLPTRVRDAA